MPGKGQRKPKQPHGDPNDPSGFRVLIDAFLENLRIRGFTDRTAGTHAWHLDFFLRWCLARDLRRPNEITRPVLLSYQRFLFYLRRGETPLSFRSQQMRLVSLRGFFRWLSKNGYLLANPAADLPLPRVPKRLPRDVLTQAEAEMVLAQPDITTPFGLRDRAMLEMFYATGIRRTELVRLSVFDVHFAKGTVFVREGKGKKDRVIPLGKRAASWISRYLETGRPKLVIEPDCGTLFLTYLGLEFAPDVISGVVKGYLEAAGISKKGSCHLFRHTMATLMLENGADTRFIQAMLGHQSLETTQVYTQVSITKLKEIHQATHPGASLESMKIRPEKDEDGSE